MVSQPVQYTTSPTTMNAARAITPAILSALRQHGDFATALARMPKTDSADLAALSDISLLCRAMALSPFKDLEVEALLTGLRRAVLERALSEPNDESGVGFAAALARHCYLNEYIFAVTDMEAEAVERVANAVATRLDRNDGAPPVSIAALAAYRPLDSFEWFGRLLDTRWSDPVDAVIAQQVAEPLAERALCGDMRRLTSVGGDVTEAVRAQYEANPYPRWIKFAAQHRAAPVGDLLRGAPLRFDLPRDRSPDAPDVLIAGCGTGQQPLLAASRYANARILAVDLSRASLAYAARKTREYGAENIEYAQADIMALDTLERRFDLIECVGVLHHLADPLAGWRILAGLLRPGGVMKVGLYSETARRDVVAARRLIAERGFAATPDGILQCRAAIAALAEAGDADMRDLIERNGFYTASECRDLIFHVQERRFTLPQIADALESLGLDFLGFEMRDTQALRQFDAAYPDARTDLARWHRFETAKPDTFRGMYQFWVRKS